MSFDFRDPDHFTAGTVGPPGQRVFFLQARAHQELATFRLEKQQVIALAEYLGDLLGGLPDDGSVEQAGDLAEPIEAAWIVGNIGVGYDNETDRIVIVAEELVDDDFEGQEARIMVRRGQVRGFIARAEELVAGGRPPCRLCGAPVNPTGHLCPRDN